MFPNPPLSSLGQLAGDRPTISLRERAVVSFCILSLLIFSPLPRIEIVSEANKEGIEQESLTGWELLLKSMNFELSGPNSHLKLTLPPMGALRILERVTLPLWSRLFCLGLWSTVLTGSCCWHPPHLTVLLVRAHQRFMQASSPPTHSQGVLREHVHGGRQLLPSSLPDPLLSPLFPSLSASPSLLLTCNRRQHCHKIEESSPRRSSQDPSFPLSPPIRVSLMDFWAISSVLSNWHWHFFLEFGTTLSNFTSILFWGLRQNLKVNILLYIHMYIRAYIYILFYTLHFYSFRV